MSVTLSQMQAAHLVAYPSFSSDPLGYVPHQAKPNESVNATEIVAYVLPIRQTTTQLTRSDANCLVTLDVSESWVPASFVSSSGSGQIDISLPPANTQQPMSFTFDFSQNTADPSKQKVIGSSTYIYINAFNNDRITGKSTAGSAFEFFSLTTPKTKLKMSLANGSTKEDLMTIQLTASTAGNGIWKIDAAGSDKVAFEAVV